MQEAQEDIAALAHRMRDSATAIISWTTATRITLARSGPDMNAIDDFLQKIVECCHDMARSTNEPTR